MSNKPKYFGVYNGPSYGSHDADFMMGFTSLRQARIAFENFYYGSVTYDEYMRTPMVSTFRGASDATASPRGHPVRTAWICTWFTRTPVLGRTSSLGRSPAA